MRDKTHSEQIERWAEHVKNNPKSWKKELKPFLDSQIIMARRFYNKLAQTPEGRRKIIEIRKLKIKETN